VDKLRKIKGTPERNEVFKKLLLMKKLFLILVIVCNNIKIGWVQDLKREDMQKEKR